MTTLMPDVLSHLAIYLNKHDMKFIKDNSVINNKLHDHIVKCGYISQYKWMLEQYNKNPRIFSDDDFGWMTPEEFDTYTWTRYTCSYAAETGNLDMLKLARIYNYRWTRRTCANAARCNHLEILQWLRANECPWDYLTYLNAVRQGNFAIIKWALANGCPDRVSI